VNDQVNLLEIALLAALRTLAMYLPANESWSFIYILSIWSAFTYFLSTASIKLISRVLSLSD